MLVNPISFRLSVSFFWNSTWSLYKNNNYKYLFSSDLVFFEFFMFFFRKTMNYRILDYYPNHMRLYRLDNKIIINLYYHMSKEEYYFDDVDLMHKSSKKKILIKKKLKKKKILNNVNKIEQYNKIFFLLNKLIIFIDKNLIKIIYLKFYLLINKNIKKLKIDLEYNLKLKWKLLKKYLLKILDSSELLIWCFIKNELKEYYYKMGKKYIYLYVNNIINKKKKFKSQLKVKSNNIPFFVKKETLKQVKKKNELVLINKIKQKVNNNNNNQKKKKLNNKNNNQFKRNNQIKKNKQVNNNTNNNQINLKKKKNSMKKYNKSNNLIKKIKKTFNKVNSFKKISKIHYNILKIKNKISKKYLLNNKYFLNSYDLNYLYKINFLKFIYNQKLWIFNIYYYYLSKFLKNLSKILFTKFLKKIELNIFKINSNSIRADIISKYITSSFKNNYNIYETMRPILVDLKDRMKKKKVAGFKITVSGRFKRAQRATYWWRKDGNLLTATQTSSIDYSSSLHKTKYGVCTVNVWLTPGLKGLGSLLHEYPASTPFFFLLKEDNFLKFKYFLLKKNEFFFSNLVKRYQISYNSLKKNYVKGLISYILYKYIYNYIFLKNIIIKNKNNKITRNLKRIFLPQYCIYKIYLEDYLRKNFIKIIPFIQIKLLKRINLRNSYKISFLNKSKFIHLDIFKYKISLY